MKEKIIKLIEERIEQLQETIRECLSDEYLEKPSENKLAEYILNVSIIEMCFLKKTELKELLDKIKELE